MTSDELLREQAYLVARGVRLLALVGADESSEAPMMRHRLLRLTEHGAIPFALGSSLCGYASHAWVIDLLIWAQNAPQLHRDRILGLLLGYSGDAIRDFEELGCSLGSFDQEVPDGHVRRSARVHEMRQPDTGEL